MPHAGRAKSFSSNSQLAKIQALRSTRFVAEVGSSTGPLHATGHRRGFSEQLAANASRGLINRVTDVKLLRGQLAAG